MDDLFRALPKILELSDGDHSVREAVVFAAWRRAVGELLLQHTSPLEVSDKKLVIAVSSRTDRKSVV